MPPTSKAAKPKPAKSALNAGAGGPPLGHLKMDDKQLGAALMVANEWAEVGGSIQRTFGFKDFVTAMAFVDKVAEAAEAAQHHPDILIRYNKVTISVNTHDAGGITQKDFDLAAELDRLAG